ncbi:MAG: energy-coupled thiamine transporter ThiT [Lachnospiraceae bacterium]|nr:energy-coupled thiamine transporter ThiT [Lachnospiraceae bacterium]
MSLFFNQEDGYYTLTSAGIGTFVAIIAVLVVLTAFLKTKTDETEKKEAKTFSTKQLVFSAAAIALGFATSYIKIVPMPWGGSITLCSMLFVTLIGYWYGPKIGLIAGFAYGLLQFVQDGGSYILSPLQACLDYILAFAALGLSGLFYKKANGLIKGYIFAILIRGLLHTIGGYLYWMDYMPESFPQSLAIIYPIAYNYAYILAEGAITIIILLLPPVKNAMTRVKKLAIE